MKDVKKNKVERKQDINIGEQKTPRIKTFSAKRT